MPRQPRLDTPGALHHVMGRGIDGIDIFSLKRDRDDFLQRLQGLCESKAISVYAWALMNNHFHLLIRTGDQPLSKSMRKILTGYAVNFNRRHKRLGHLFQNRYKSILCEDDPYLLELTRYIHLNPLRAGLVKNVEALNKSDRSGHSALMGAIDRPWQNQDTVLAYFGKNRHLAIEKYAQFVEEGVKLGRRPELVGGGLVRSLGGWSQVLSERRKGTRTFHDERILGGSDFAAEAIKEAEEKEKDTLRLKRTIPTLETLAARIRDRERIEISELRSGSKKNNVTRARRIFCQIARKKLGYSGAEVARYLGVTTSAVNRSAKTREMPDLESYL